MYEIVEQLPIPERSQTLISALKKEILILDGGFGTMIQKQNLNEADFSGECECGHCHHVGNKERKGCNDILNITRPDIIATIHREYLEAGADIIETNTFNANAISLADYSLNDRVTEINREAAMLARKTSDEHSKRTGHRSWVAGSIGPSSKSLTMAASLGDDVDWSIMTDAYLTQAKALIEGGVDMLLIETVFDVLNAKAAVFACRKAMLECGVQIPIAVSFTLTESGRTLSGMTPQAAIAAVMHCSPIAVGFNCGFGAEGMIKYINEIQDTEQAIIMYPNAGLPNELGEYDETPEKMATDIAPLLKNRQLNIVGGCCGTTPEHIAAIARVAKAATPRPIPEKDNGTLILSGLEALNVGQRDFVNIGERCNVAGSRKFLRLIKEDNIDEAINVARDQIIRGADIIDINMDDGMLDTAECMSRFLTRIATEPSVAGVPFMIDSSDFNVIKKALTLIQGRPAVNSISLKEGEEIFIGHAREIHEFGGAIVVMAFDEDGQATTLERRIEVCRRAYDLLTRKAGIAPCDIIFDPNILAVATGIPEHDSYGKDFIDAAGWIMENLPEANVSGGLSNLSFSFRGNDFVRNAMHSIFIAKARERRMKMAIVNPSGILPVDTIPADLRQAIEDVLDNRGPHATEHLIETAQRYRVEKTKAPATTATRAEQPVEARLADAIVNGTSNRLNEMLVEALAKTGNAVKVIDEILMAGMNTVGERFGRGEMYLPQVVKSATIMKQAVDILTPEIERQKSADFTANAKTYKMVLATVKGDVHDIGKNIVDVVMRCNGFDTIDLGVMTPAEKIVETAIDSGADCVGLSGLITPSLAEMTEVARQMQAKGLTIPLFIGGATTSDIHTALKIATAYDGPVIHTSDAASLAAEAKKYLDKSTVHEAVRQLREMQENLRAGHKSNVRTLNVAEARSLKPSFDFNYDIIQNPTERSVMKIPVSEVIPMINYRQFLSAWGLSTNSSDKPETKKLLDDAKKFIDRLVAGNENLTACTVFLDASSTDNDDIIIYGHDDTLTLPMLRQSTASPADGRTLSLSDFFPNENTGQRCPIGLFAVTVTKTLHDRLVSDPKSYDGILADLMLNRLAEAATQYLHEKLTAGASFKGIRPAIGYSSMPDQSLVLLFDRLLNYESLDIETTQNGALFPSSTTTGLFILHPDARYFSVLPVGDNQRRDYIGRRGFTSEQADTFLPQIMK